MATITKKLDKEARVRLGNAPYGNLTAFTFGMQCTATGAVIGTEAAQSGTTAAGTVVRLGVLPAGFRLVDYKASVSVAFTGSVTLDVGFEYVDGVNSTTVPQDDDYFASGAGNTAVVTRKATTTKEVTLPKDAYLIVTVKSQANATAAAAEFTVFAVADGPN